MISKKRILPSYTLDQRFIKCCSLQNQVLESTTPSDGKAFSAKERMVYLNQNEKPPTHMKPQLARLTRSGLCVW